MRFRVAFSHRLHYSFLFYFSPVPFQCIVCFSISCSFTLLFSPPSSSIYFNTMRSTRKKWEKSIKQYDSLKLNLQLFIDVYLVSSSIEFLFAISSHLLIPFLSLLIKFSHFFLYPLSELYCLFYLLDAQVEVKEKKCEKESAFPTLLCICLPACVREIECSEGGK